MMRHPFAVHRVASFLVVLLSGAPSAVAAQEQRPALAEPPARYDADLLPPAFHRSRRDSVLRTLPPDAFALVLSAPQRNREGDVDYEYRQSSDLYYLTGMTEPNAVLLLAPAGITVDGAAVPEVLFVPPRDPSQEVWTGRRLGAERAQRELGVARAVTVDQLPQLLEQLAAADRRLYHLPLPTGVAEGSPLADQLALLTRLFSILPPGGEPQSYVVRALLATDSEEAFRRNRRLLDRVDEVAPDTFFAPGPLREIAAAYRRSASFTAWQAWRRANVDARFADGTTLRRRLDALRTVKTPEEVALLRRAIDITAVAHREAMKSIEPGMHEYEVAALVEYVFHRNGAETPAFPSIVGSGENAVILHYETNRRRMRAGDLVVIDIGAEYHGYCADVTRTVPVGGRFSPEQRMIYELVLRAQSAGIRAVQVGAPFRAAHEAARDVIADGLMRLGLIREAGEVSRFFNHGTSHYLGLGVHDVGTGGPLTPGTVLTVEPGIYIPASPDVDRSWWNIGVRIEDDVLVTDAGPVVLSEAAPRAPDEIEALMAERGLGNDPAGVVPRPDR